MNTETILELLKDQKPIRLRLTLSEAYRRKQRLWKLHCEHAQSVRRAFFPDTGGVSLYLHNWYKCGADKAKAALAEWIDDSTLARYRRLEALMEARDVRREHEHHSKQTIEEIIRVGRKWETRMRPFDAMWCPLCPHVH